MAWSIVWSETAATKLFEIEDWLHGRSPAAAKNFVEQIDRDVSRLSEHPESAPLWQRYPNIGVRRLVSAKTFLVFYELNHAKEEVVVLTLRDARQPPLDPQNLQE